MKTTYELVTEVVPWQLLPPVWRTVRAALFDHWGEDYDIQFVSPRVSLGCFVFRWSSLDAATRDRFRSDLLAVAEKAACIHEFTQDPSLQQYARIWESPSDLECWLTGLLWLCDHADSDFVRARAAEDFIFAGVVHREMRRLELDVFDVIPRDVDRSDYFSIIRSLAET